MNKQEWFDKAKAAGFAAFEIGTSRESGRSLTWYQGDMDTFVTKQSASTTLRALTEGGRQVVITTEHPEELDADAVLKKMAETAAVITSEDESFIREPAEALPAASKYHFVQPEPEAIRQALAAVEAKLSAYDPRIAQVTDLEWEEESAGKEVDNSRGMAVAESGCAQLLIAGVAAAENGEVKSEFRVEVVEDLAAFDADTFVKKLCDEAIGKLGGAPIPSGAYPVILEKEAMTGLFSALSGMFSGDLIGKGISPLRDKLGQAVFSEKITVTDDPRLPELLMPVAYDDEGCPTARKELVKDGVFVKMLHDTKSGARMKAESTGNGFRGGVRPMGLGIEPGEKTLEQMMADMGDGLVITDLAGLHAGIDHVTTDFSLQCSGYLVKGGKRDRAVTLITVAGNFLDMMKHVVCVGSDVEWKYRTIAAPSIAFESLSIAGE